MLRRKASAAGGNQRSLQSDTNIATAAATCLAAAAKPGSAIIDLAAGPGDNRDLTVAGQRFVSNDGGSMDRNA